MKWRKLILGIVFSVIVAGLMPFASAQESNLDVNTETEVKAMVTPYGAQVRLFQLEKSITKNIVTGETVIEVIIDNNTDVNLVNANLIIEKLKILLNEVKTADINAHASVLATEYVAMKKQAIALSAEFRAETSKYLTSEDRENIKALVKESEVNVLAKINAQIKASVREHNANLVLSVLADINSRNDVLVQAIRDGRENLAEARAKIRSEFELLREEQKRIFEQKIKEKLAQRIISEKNIVVVVEQNWKEEYENRGLKISTMIKGAVIGNVSTENNSGAVNSGANADVKTSASTNGSNAESNTSININVGVGGN